MADPDFQAFLSSQIGDLQRQIHVLQGRLSARHEDEVRPLLNKISSLKADNHGLRHRLDIKPPPEQDVPQPPPASAGKEEDVEVFSNIGAPKDEPVALALVESETPGGGDVSAPDDQGCWSLSAPALLQINSPSMPNRSLSQASFQMPECALTKAATERNSCPTRDFPLIADKARNSISNEYMTMVDRGSVFVAPGELLETKSSSEDEAVQAFSQKSSSSIQSMVQQVSSGDHHAVGKALSAQIAGCQRAFRHSFESEHDKAEDDKKHSSESDRDSSSVSDNCSVKAQATQNGHGDHGDKNDMCFQELFSGKYPLHAVWTQQVESFSHVVSMNKRRSVSTRSQTSNVTSGEEMNLGGPVERQLMMRPNSAMNMAWDVLALLAVIYDFVVIPLYIFDANQEHYGVQDALSAPSIILRVFWLADIPLQFLTGYIDDKGRQHTSPKRVARRYITTWLLPDLACCALDWTEFILQASGRHPIARGILCACRMLRGQRLVRLAEAPELHEFMIEHIHNERVILTLSICRVLVLMAFYTHLIACGWYGLGVTGRDESTSVTKYAKIERMAFIDRYVWAFHCALGLFTGEHVEMPRNSRERVYTIFVLFFTFMMTIWFVSTITTNMTRLQIMSGQRATQFSALGRYLADHHISRDLCIKVRRNAQYVVATQTKHTPESSIELLSLISTPLRRELHFEVHSPLLIVHPFFRTYIDIYPTAIKKVCHEAIRLLTFSPGDIVFTEFEAPTVPRMFWVADGELKYIQDVSQQKRVCYGNWLSEALLWTRWTHRGTLESKTESELMSLDASQFANIVANFPGMQVRNYAIQFCKNLETTREEEVTDVGFENREAEWLVDVAFGSTSRRTKSRGVRFQLTSVRRHSKTAHSVSLKGLSRTSGWRNSEKKGAKLNARRVTGGEELRVEISGVPPTNGESSFTPSNSYNILGSVLRRSNVGT